MALFYGWFGLQNWFGNRAKLTEPDARAQAQTIQFGRPVTPDAAMQLATVWSCVRLLSETIGTLPLAAYRRQPGSNRTLARDHGLYSLLHDNPNADQSAVEFWEAVVACLCLWGNAYAEKAYNGVGDVAALNMVPPDRMQVTRDANGARVYSWTDSRGRAHKKGEQDIFHVRGFGIGLDQGLSPIGYLASDDGVDAAYDTYFPDGRWAPDALRIRYTAGYAAVPPSIIAALLLMVGDLFANRETTLDGRAAGAASVPMSLTVESLLSPFRVFA